MNKKDLQIIVVHKSKVAFAALKTILISVGFKNIKYFNSSIEYINYLNDNNVDLVFIEYDMSEINGLELLNYTKEKSTDIVVAMLSNKVDEDKKNEAIKNNVNEFINENVDFFEFKTKLNILSNLRLNYYESKTYQKQLETLLKYKDTQENLAVQKQLKIIEDNISNHYFNNWIFDSYFKPKDILSGDSYSTVKIGENKFFISVVDGMGKGVSASLSSVLTVSFINYSIAQIQSQTFDFDKIVQNTAHYASSIMLEKEALSFAMIELDLDKNVIRYANMGLPPLYLLNKDEVIKLRPNNRPLIQHYSSEVIIDKFDDEFDTFLVASDGLFESEDFDGYPYFVKFKRTFNQHHLLSDLIKAFKSNVEVADDDTTIVYLRKDTVQYDTIANKEILLTRENIENVVNNIEFELDVLPAKIVNKIVFSLNELLINCYEHGALKLGENKHNMIKENEKITQNHLNSFANLQILHNDKYAMIHLEDDGDGFDISKVLKSEWFNKYHGRGIKMIKKLSDGIYYNEKGNKVKIYFALS